MQRARGPLGIIDTTAVPTQARPVNPWDYWFVKRSGKSGFNAFKWEVLTAADGSDRILWVWGPLKTRWSDVTLFDLNLRERMKRGEWILGDRGYMGRRPQIFAGYKPEAEPWQRRISYKMNRVRSRVEHVFGILKSKWAFLRCMWRHSADLNRVSFQVVAKIHNLSR